MRAFRAFFAVYLKKNLRNIPLMISLLLLPVSVILLNIPVTETTGIDVGIFAQAQGVYEERVMSGLEESDAYNFLRYEEEENMIEDIEKGEISLGYSFDEDFSHAVESGDIEESVRLIMYPDNMYYTFVNEQVFNEIFAVSIPITVQNFLQPTQYSQEEIAELIEEYASADTAFEIVATTLEGEVAEDTGNLHIINGVICLYLLTLALITCMNAGERTAFLPYLSTLAARFYAVLPTFVLATLVGCVSAALGAVLANGGNDVWLECMKVTIYQASLLPFCLLVAALLKKNILVVLIPFVLVFVLITHPIFFDITVYVQGLKGVLAFLPSYNFMNFSIDLTWIASNVAVVGGVCLLHLYYKKKPI